ncbi:unnamed protein product [Prorocentrum cordatum]|uniref:Uncharacterized protein n=1 Tax=Prorocentrum cordatum TaxID=2364126 RepID=A0ABN9R290_9DINO|nr:unnamed protein product [Polarella glacialis]
MWQGPPLSCVGIVARDPPQVPSRSPRAGGARPSPGSPSLGGLRGRRGGAGLGCALGRRPCPSGRRRATPCGTDAVISAGGDPKAMKGWTAMHEEVPGLADWVIARGIHMHVDKVNEWCREMGPADLQEVVENEEDLAEYLGELLTPDQRDRFGRLGRR